MGPLSSRCLTTRSQRFDPWPLNRFFTLQFEIGLIHMALSRCRPRAVQQASPCSSASVNSPHLSIADLCTTPQCNAAASLPCCQCHRKRTIVRSRRRLLAVARPPQSRLRALPAAKGLPRSTPRVPIFRVLHVVTTGDDH